MPAFDKTGPNGAGPMTGRGMGPCGGGRGRGMGYGRGFANQPGCAYCPAWNNTTRMTKDEERAMLEEEVKAVQEEMDDMKKRLDELKGE